MKIMVYLPDRDGKPRAAAVEAERWGKYFAVHRDVRWAKDSNGQKTFTRVLFNRTGYTVTHIPTGYAVMNSIRRRSNAVKIAARLTALKSVNWDMKKPSTFRKYSGSIPKDIVAFANQARIAA